MSSIIIKLIYLLTGAGLTIGALKRKNIKNKDNVILFLCLGMAFCFGFWGVSTIFHSIEGYPPQWFFYLTSVPVLISSILLVINIKNK